MAQISVFLLLFICSFYFVNIVNSANILGVFIFPSISHQMIYRPIWRELSLRGHQLTVITPDPLNDPKLVNLTEIDVHHAYNVLKVHRLDLLLSKDLGRMEFTRNNYQLMEYIILDEFNNPQVQRLLSDRNRKFDLILIEVFHPLLYGLAGRFKAPIIGVSSLGITAPVHDVVGNPVHPALNPDTLFNYPGGEMGLYDKFFSVLHHTYHRYYYNYELIPKSDTIARKYFGDDIPSLAELKKSLCMLFLNVNPILNPVRPNVPAVIEMRRMHIQQSKPLPQDLKKILDEAREGVIYFSLGSNVKSVNLPETLRKNIITALSELPYKVLWKWESDHLPDQPDNVITRKWLPQQDILEHPNIKAFVTQGGVQSIEEAIIRGVPLVAMPFMGDQSVNSKRMADLGAAIKVDPTTVTKNELKQAILTVAQDEKFKNQMLEIRDVFVDEPTTGLERVIWWSEYVIRHKGAKYLKGPAADTPWYSYYLLDVLSVVILILSVFLYVICFLIKKILFNSSLKTKRD